MQIKLTSKLCMMLIWCKLNIKQVDLHIDTLNHFQCGINFLNFMKLPLEEIAIQTEFKMMLQHLDQTLTNMWCQIDFKMPTGLKNMTHWPSNPIEFNHQGFPILCALCVDITSESDTRVTLNSFIAYKVTPHCTCSTL